MSYTKDKNDNITVTIESENDDIPNPEFIKSVVRLACLSFNQSEAQINVQVVDEKMMISLNKQYRGKKRPTNVLSFKSDLPNWVESNLIGDIVLCPSVIRLEAKEFNKTTKARWTHMLVHGTLHLLGMTHDDETQRIKMEAMELKLMNEFGYENPYLLTT